MDTSEYDRGLDDASGKAHNFGEKLKTGLANAAKIGAAAIATATAAVGAFAKASIDTGAQFDSAMSQVAATMGLTAQDIQNNVSGAGAGDTFSMLREKALEMGSATKFTSQEAAEGLNILAMSGYGATEAVGMIEDVLHLAAAGSMDMASAAGYVSGAMKGFADNTKDAEYYADLMAKGATLANTDVTQLGEALSGGAAAAKSYWQSAETVTLALLRLAEQGEVGSAASTALGAAMKNLYAPTDQAAKLLQQLGVQAFDSATGSARDFNDVVNELDAALSGYSDQQKTAYAQTIFGIQGFDAYNKMVVTSTEKQGEWATALSEASGEAGRQYETMTDNLVGDIDKWNSALDGFKITLSDKLTPTLREFTQFGANSVGQITAAFQEGGLSGAMEALGGVLSNGLAMITEQLPSAIDAGMQLLGAVGQGLIDNLPVITDAALEIVTMLITGMASSLPKINSSAFEIITTLANGISEQLPELVPVAVDAILQLVDTLTDPDNLSNLFDSSIDLIMSLADGLIDALPGLVEKAPEIVQNLVNAIVENAGKLPAAALELITKLAGAIIENLPEIVDAGEKILDSILEGLGDLAAQAFEWGANLLTGLWNGIWDKVEWLKSQVSGVVDKIKSWFTGEEGFDEHSPSKWSQGVAEFVMQGLGIGFENGKGEVMQTVEDIIGEIKSRFDEVSNFFTAKSDVSGLEYQLWERTEGKNVSEIEKYAKKLGLLTSQQEDQALVVEAAEAAYASVVEQYGLASTESYNYQKALLQERLALQDLLDQIQEVNAARAQIQSEINMQEAQIKWESSGLGLASATAMNAGSITPHEVAQIANINLVTPDGKVLAEYTAPALVDYMNANGTPIVNPKT